jgi:hypothetical protein
MQAAGLKLSAALRPPEALPLAPVSSCGGGRGACRLGASVGVAGGVVGGVVGALAVWLIWVAAPQGPEQAPPLPSPPPFWTRLCGEQGLSPTSRREVGEAAQRLPLHLWGGGRHGVGRALGIGLAHILYVTRKAI